MARTRSKHGSNRLVVYISDENFLAMNVALTPPGNAKPDFGNTSQFINRLLDDWRARRAQQLDGIQRSEA